MRSQRSQTAATNSHLRCGAEICCYTHVLSIWSMTLGFGGEVLEAINYLIYSCSLLTSMYTVPV